MLEGSTLHRCCCLSVLREDLDTGTTLALQSNYRSIGTEDVYLTVLYFITKESIGVEAKNEICG